jgi:hypothetical protein
MSHMEQLTDEQVERLLPALAEAARATQASVERFVPPRRGIVEEVAARAHQFVLGRRGVGKSSLLRKIEETTQGRGTPVVFIDLETLRGVPYPDVLIRLLVTFLDVLDAQLKRRERPIWRAEEWRLLRLRLRDRRLRRQLEKLLQAPQSAEHTVRELESQSVEVGVGADLRATAGALVPASLKIGASGRRGRRRDATSEARFTKTKMDGLHYAAPHIRRLLQETLGALDGKGSFLLLDDFYHVSQEDQPRVLAYLHQVVKNLEVWLKVSGVRHRLNPFLEGDPPMGLQVGQDAAEVSLDLTLDNFNLAKDFLESVLAGICRPHGVELEQMLTEGGRTRLVLASGGVARDYLNLARMALRRATERPHRTYLPRNRISAEDVNEASAELSNQKQEDLRLDSGENAERLRQRLADVARFCLDFNGTNVFLVAATDLHETEWGAEIEALADLRFVHEIGNVSVRSSDYRGTRFGAFTLDLSNYTGTRSERIKQIDFWEPGGRSELRRAGLIYAPEGERSTAAAEGGDTPTTRLPVDWAQPPLPGFEGEV